jgi:hypothetical protein
VVNPAFYAIRRAASEKVGSLGTNLRSCLHISDLSYLVLIPSKWLEMEDHAKKREPNLHALAEIVCLF